MQPKRLQLNAGVGDGGVGGVGAGGGVGDDTNEIESDPLPIKPYAHPALGTSRVDQKSFFPVYITTEPPLPVATTPKSPLPTSGPLRERKRKREEQEDMYVVYKLTSVDVLPARSWCERSTDVSTLPAAIVHPDKYAAETCYTVSALL